MLDTRIEGVDWQAVARDNKKEYDGAMTLVNEAHLALNQARIRIAAARAVVDELVQKDRLAADDAQRLIVELGEVA